MTTAMGTATIKYTSTATMKYTSTSTAGTAGTSTTPQRHEASASNATALLCTRGQHT